MVLATSTALCSKRRLNYTSARKSLILSSCTSRFTSFYMMKWKEFFPNKDLAEPPYFEAELLCYPKQKIICDYLSLRQAECHTSNQYNKCFWMLVKSGKREHEVHEILKEHYQRTSTSCFSSNFI